jgi:hypothetical protein
MTKPIRGIVNIPVPTPKQLARFWSKIDQSAGPNECWPWTASISSTGYGQLRVQYVRVYAHRAAYEWTTGEDITGWYIDHLCHVPVCCNPAHLRRVTQQQNSENKRGPSKNSTTGIRGVYKSGNRWFVKIYKNGQHIYVGRFDTAEEATAAAQAARREHMPYSEMDKEAI